MGQWDSLSDEVPQGPDMEFVVGGYNTEEPYGQVFHVRVGFEVTNPRPKRPNKSKVGVPSGI